MSWPGRSSSARAVGCPLPSHRSWPCTGYPVARRVVAVGQSTCGRECRWVSGVCRGDRLSRHRPDDSWLEIPTLTAPFFASTASPNRLAGFPGVEMRDGQPAGTHDSPVSSGQRPGSATGATRCQVGRVGARNFVHLTRPAGTREVARRVGRAAERCGSWLLRAGAVIAGERPGQERGVAGDRCSGVQIGGVRPWRGADR